MNPEILDIYRDIEGIHKNNLKCYFFEIIIEI